MACFSDVFSPELVWYDSELMAGSVIIAFIFCEGWMNKQTIGLRTMAVKKRWAVVHSL